MNQIELFAGIGGFGLAGHWADIETVCQVEIDPFCQKVLQKNFPHAHRHDDIHTFDGRPWHGSVDIVSGGFPFQPYSHAGQRKGNDDDRALWPQMLRVIREVRPTWVIGENVAGLITMDGGRVFDGIVTDLEDAGYTVEAFVIPACAVGAPHRRDRVWIVAHRDGQRQQQQEGVVGDKRGRLTDGDQESLTSNPRRQRGYGQESYRVRQTNEYGNANNEYPWQEHWLPVATRLCRVDDGLSRKMDKSKRLKALGNAIVPQVAYQIFQAIKSATNDTP